MTQKPMPIVDIPLASGGIFRDFESDVLAQLVRHNAEMHGCPVWKVECKLDGAVAVWFHGLRDEHHWEGALRFNFPLLRDKKWLGDVNAVTETTLHLLDKIRQDAPRKLVERAALH